MAFFFGVLFLVCAAVAIALRTVPLGESADDGVAVAAAAVLVIAGVIGIAGSLRNHHRRSVAGASAGGAPEAGGEPSAAQPPKTWTT